VVGSEAEGGAWPYCSGFGAVPGSRRVVMEGEGAAEWELACCAGGGGMGVSGDHLYPPPSPSAWPC